MPTKQPDKPHEPKIEEVPNPQIVELEEKITLLQQEKDEIFARLQRSSADYQNLKKQNEAEKAEWIRFANGKLLLDLIEVLDNLERAVHSVPEEILQSEWYKGFVLAKTSLDNLIKKEGLERIECVMKIFDPTQHEAILYQESPDVEPEHILSEVKAGYSLQGKIVRPAQVIVSKGPATP
jgi:molecular chaperone GrpE